MNAKKALGAVVVLRKVDAAVDAVVVGPLGKFDIKLTQQRPVALPKAEFMGLELLCVGHIYTSVSMTPVGSG